MMKITKNQSDKIANIFMIIFLAYTILASIIITMLLILNVNDDSVTFIEKYRIFIEQ
ncbi:MAG: hypothetical protein HeimC3_16880 [Candidatus Heimdallarchaeota archaeon LC_3]|nr:MAG: hypothetical protein HeimC3_16880 [Candidatus Heimdallarchaeota archaeon LC_3]